MWAYTADRPAISTSLRTSRHTRFFAELENICNARFQSAFPRPHLGQRWMFLLSMEARSSEFLQALKVVRFLECGERERRHCFGRVRVGTSWLKYELSCRESRTKDRKRF